ncbi:hypothetical protein FO519_002625 [Halicephalobus sp. NKZ332]|nr:hypothetical protein FO519_002625 [Halicephalobus sp. NKZ332]
MVFGWLKRILRKNKKTVPVNPHPIFQQSPITLIKANSFTSSRNLAASPARSIKGSGKKRRGLSVRRVKTVPVGPSLTSDISKHLVVQKTNIDDALEAMRRDRKKLDEVHEDSEEFEEVSSVFSVPEGISRDLVIRRTSPKISRLASLPMNAPQIYTNKFAVSKIPNLRQNSGWYSSRPYGQSGAHYYFRTSGSAALFHRSKRSTMSSSTISEEQQVVMNVKYYRRTVRHERHEIY